MPVIDKNLKSDLKNIEEFKNFNINELFVNDYTLQIGGVENSKLEDGFITIKIVNGIPITTNLPKGIIISEECLTEIDSFNPLININFKQVDVLYNITFTENFETPVKVINYYTGKDSFTPSNIRFRIYNNKVLNILETTNNRDKVFVNNNREFDIKNATINYSRVDSLSEKSNQIFNYYGTIDRGELNVISLNNSGHINMNIWDINLVSPKATCNVSGIIDIKSTMRHGTICKINHNAPETISSQEFRHIVDQESYAMYDGDSTILNCAKGSVTSQQSKSIMLSEHARVYNKPRLNIYTGEVKATHGATVGKLNPEDIFYLQQRGMSSLIIKKLLINAFIIDLLDKIESLKIREFLYDKK